MNFMLSCILPSVLAGVALWKKALTPAGTALAWVLSFGITYIGGAAAFAILTATFLLVIAADKAAGGRADPDGVRRKSGTRDAWRVLCNVGVGSVAMALYAVTCKRSFLYAYAAVMAESLSDSLASKIGPLSGGATVDLCSLRPMHPGLSGGVSVLGSGAGAAGAAIVGALCLLFPGVSYGKAAAIAAAGFAGCVFDSVLGSLAQVKYQCPACGMIVERETHCGVPTKACRGLRPINNDAVNLLSNLFSFLLAALFL